MHKSKEFLTAFYVFVDKEAWWKAWGKFLMCMFVCERELVTFVSLGHSMHAPVDWLSSIELDVASVHDYYL